jgi:carboxypeptidase PM20D1
MKWIRRGALLLAVLLAAALAVGFARFAAFKSPPLEVEDRWLAVSLPEIDAHAAAVRLGQAIRFATVSGPTASGMAPFDAMRDWLAETYPAVFQGLTVETVAGGSLLLTWPGGDPSLPPLVLLAHQDVVPATDEADWTHSPFSGEIADGYVWGRGAMDDKGPLIASLEAIEALLAAGYQPRRTIMLGFGHDEEVEGRGAQATAERLRASGVKPWAVMDEGYPVLLDFPLTGGPVALVGAAEKGYLTLRVSARGEAGHSSTPPRSTAVASLAQAVVRMQSMDIASDVDGTVTEMFRHVAEGLPALERFAMANADVMKPLLVAAFDESDASRALLKTTQAPTMLEGSERENVLPAEAWALVNFRLHPRDSSASVLDMAQRAVAGVEGVEVSIEPGVSEPVPQSALGEPFALLRSVVHELDPMTPTAPGLMIGATDSRHYRELTTEIYRFTPVRVTQEEYERIHGDDERISVDNMGYAIRFYMLLISAA